MIEEAEVAEEIGETEVAGRPQKESAVAGLKVMQFSIFG